MDSDNTLASREPQEPVTQAQSPGADKVITRWADYLAGLCRGRPPEQAIKAAGISPAELCQMRAQDPDARRLEELASIAGMRGDGKALARALGQGAAPTMLLDAVEASRSADYERDRVANRRLVLETAQVLGAQGQPGAQVAVQVNVYPPGAGYAERIEAAEVEPSNDRAPHGPPPPHPMERSQADRSA